MVGKRSKRRRNGLLGNHQRCWLWGRHAVLETLRAGCWLPVQVRIGPEQLTPAVRSEVRQLAQSRQVPLVEVADEELDQLAGRQEHQGLMARMPEFPYADFSKTLAALPQNPFVLVLDRIQDPFNFGAILRSAEILGVAAVFVASREQAAVSSHVVRSSAGAVNFLPIVQTESLLSVLEELRRRGLQTACASEKGNSAPDSVNLTGPTALLIGNEGSGPAEELINACDVQLSIPQSGHVGSLNAAVAAGILCYEIARQRRTLKT